MKLLRFSLAVVALVFASGGPPALRAQPAAVGAPEAFEASEYHEEPYHTQLKWRITGAKAEPKGRNVLLSGVLLEMFSKTGSPDLVVETPECVYDSDLRRANSPGHLKVRVAEGRFAVEGDGFLWQQSGQTNSTLFISNNIQAAVRRDITNAAAAPMLVTSGRFTFSSEKNEGVFRDRVRAEDPEVGLACQILTAAATGTNKVFETLVAEREVQLLSKKDGLAASADKALFQHTNETLVLNGKVSWKQPGQEGRANHAILRRQEKELQADGDVSVKMARAGLGLDGLLGGTNASPARLDTNVVTVYTQHLFARTNFTRMEGSVRILDATNSLACDTLEVRTEGKEQVAVADGHVVACHGGDTQCLRAARAVYTKSTGATVFTGDPTWKMEQSEGRAREVTLRGENEIRALGDVAARVDLGSQSNAVLNLFPDANQTNQTSRIIEVFGDDLTAGKTQVVLRGHARVHQSPITGSEPNLRADTLTLQFTTDRKVEQMLAQDNVRFQQGTVGVTNEPNAYREMTTDRLTAHFDAVSGAVSNLVAEGHVRAEQPEGVARGGRAVYVAATELLELTEDPSVRTPEAAFTGANRIVWNRKTNKIYAVGAFTGTGQTNALQKLPQFNNPLK